MPLPNPPPKPPQELWVETKPPTVVVVVVHGAAAVGDAVATAPTPPETKPLSGTYEQYRSGSDTVRTVRMCFESTYVGFAGSDLHRGSLKVQEGVGPCSRSIDCSEDKCSAE